MEIPKYLDRYPGLRDSADALAEIEREAQAAQESNLANLLSSIGQQKDYAPIQQSPINLWSVLGAGLQGGPAIEALAQRQAQVEAANQQSENYLQLRKQNRSELMSKLRAQLEESKIDFKKSMASIRSREEMAKDERTWQVEQDRIKAERDAAEFDRRMELQEQKAIQDFLGAEFGQRLQTAMDQIVAGKTLVEVPGKPGMMELGPDLTPEELEFLKSKIYMAQASIPTKLFLSWAEQIEQAEDAIAKVTSPDVDKTPPSTASRRDPPTRWADDISLMLGDMDAVQGMLDAVDAGPDLKTDMGSMFGFGMQPSFSARNPIFAKLQERLSSAVAQEDSTAGHRETRLNLFKKQELKEKQQGTKRVPFGKDWNPAFSGRQ